jgi:hypothetical protein
MFIHVKPIHVTPITWSVSTSAWVASYFLCTQLLDPFDSPITSLSIMKKLPVWGRMGFPPAADLFWYQSLGKKISYSDLLSCGIILLCDASGNGFRSFPSRKILENFLRALIKETLCQSPTARSWICWLEIPGAFKMRYALTFS